MVKTTLTVEQFVNDIYESKGKKYSIHMKTLSPFENYEFCLASGIIDNCFLENECIYIVLDGNDNSERFTLSIIKEITVDHNDRNTHYIITFRDNGYFRIIVE